ncbi:Macrophage mannose receptor 1, partial [Stegodyphus mimosarum]
MALYLYLFISLIGFSFSVAWRNFEYCEGTSWINFKENCYLFETKSHKRISFYDAEDYCRSQGAHLLSIHSEEENDFVLNTMSKGRFGDRHWIGLNVLAGDDKPQWSDDSPVDFQKRVPKDFFVNEKCFIIFLEKRGWRPEHCALHYAPICKRPADVTPTPVPPPTTVPPPQGNCPENWIQFDQKCYKYFGAKEEDRVQYKQARDACWALGKNHDLVSIHSIEEQAFLTQNLYKLGTSAWIGMRQVTSDEIGHDLVFGWIDNSRTDFKYWAAGHPPPGTWKYCARLSYETVAKGEWIADYCEISKYGYICQQPSDPNVPPPKPESSKCDAGSLSYRDSCYRYVLKPSTHEEAEKSCQNFGGHLASVVDGFEQAFLFNLLGSYSLSRDQFRFLWNGLKGVQV